MHRGRDFIGTALRAGEGGDVWGEITDVVIAADGHISGFVVLPTKGLIRKERTVGVGSLLRIDPKECVAEQAFLASKDDGDLAGLRLYAEGEGLCGRALLTEDGRELGEIGDVVLESVERPLWGFEVSDGILRDLLDGRPVVEAAGACLEGESVVFRSDAGEHMNLDPDGHANE